MGVCAVGAWLVRWMWLGRLANKMLYKTTITNVIPPPRDHIDLYITSAFDDAQARVQHRYILTDFYKMKYAGNTEGGRQVC